MNKMPGNEEEKLVEQPHSVEISYNAKGQASGKVKCYGTTPSEALDKSVKLSEELYKLIKAKNSF